MTAIGCVRSKETEARKAWRKERKAEGFQRSRRLRDAFEKKKRKDSPAMTKSAPSAALAVFFEARLALAFLALAEPRDPERTSRASSARAAARWDFMTSGFVEVWRRRREKKNVRMEKKVRKLTFFSRGVRILTSSSKARSEQAT